MALDTDLFNKIKTFTQYHILLLEEENLMGFEEFSDHIRENIEAEGMYIDYEKSAFVKPDDIILFLYMNYLIVKKLEVSTKEMIYLQQSAVSDISLTMQ